MRLLRFIYYRLYQLMISVGNGDVAEYYAIFLMAMLFGANVITISSLIYAFTGVSIELNFQSKTITLIEYLTLAFILYQLFVKDEKYLEIAEYYKDEPVKKKRSGKIIIICYFALSLVSMIFGFFLMLMRNRGKL